MVTLFSQGDYDFVMRGGPWIFKRNALLLKELDKATSPSEMVLDAVPVWVRIYDVPWGKQNKAWGMKVGNGLGKAVEVDAPSDEQDMNEFLRVRIELPYDKRLQTQIAVGVKGKPGQFKTYKLKYERVPYFCAHCGFMGHKKESCEKRRKGVPSLDYEAYELRCSPFKKFESRAHFVPPASQTRRGMSFGSFGSVESRKSAMPTRSRVQSFDGNQSSLNRRREDTQEEDMPPLEDIIPGQGGDTVAVGVRDGFDDHEKTAGEEVEQNLLYQIDAMKMNPVMQQRGHGGHRESRTEPYVQFPDEENPAANTGHPGATTYVIEQNILHRMQQAPGTRPGSMGGRSGPRSGDMIPAMQGLSSLQVSFGSATDVPMADADSVLGKRIAGEEEEVQGQHLDLSLGLNYGDGLAGGQQKRGRKHAGAPPQSIGAGTGALGGQRTMKATGHVTAVKKAKPHV
jgi:hypothetical protein